MTSTALALLSPLVPEDCDVRGLPFMPFEVVRFLESDLVALASPEEGWASVRLWAKSWLQVPAGSMKDDDRLLAAAAGVSAADWRNLREFVLKGWRRADDGRLYHPVVSEKALEAWIGRLAHQRRSALANAAKYDKGTASVEGFETRIRDCIERLRALNPKAASDVEKGLKFLLGGSDAPTRSEKPSLTTKKSSQGTGTGRGTAEEEPLRGSMPDATEVAPDAPPAELESGLASELEKAKPAEPPAPPAPPEPEKPTKANPKKGSSRIEADWIADDDLRDYAKVNLATAGLPHEDADLNRLEDAFRDHWLASSKAEAFKLDWKAAFRTWVRNEIRFAPKGGSNGRSNSTGPRRGGVHDAERLRAFVPRGPLGPH